VLAFSSFKVNSHSFWRRCLCSPVTIFLSIYYPSVCKLGTSSCAMVILVRGDNICCNPVVLFCIAIMYASLLRSVVQHIQVNVIVIFLENKLTFQNQMT
jgi:hypothetical protein